MFVSKDTRGNWRAQSSKPLPDGRVLDLTTFKDYSGKLYTTARVSKTDGKWQTFSPFTDFNKALEITKPKRITAKVVEAQHAAYDLDTIAVDAIAFYKERDHG